MNFFLQRYRFLVFNQQLKSRLCRVVHVTV